MKELLKKVGAKYFMPVPTGYSENAVDFLVCFKGHFVAIETKIHPRKPTALQIDFLVQVHKAGGSSVVAYDMEEVYLALACIDDGSTWASDCLKSWIEE